MASAFNLTAQINLRGPNNLKPIVAQIKRELGSVSASVKVTLDNKSAKSIDNITNRLQVMNSVLVQTKSNVADLNQAFATLSSSLTSIKSAGNATSSAITKTSQGVKQTAQNIKVARTEMEEFGRQAFLATKRFAAFTLVTTGIFALTNAVTSGFRAFITFNKELIRLQQVTGKGAIGISSLEKEITRLATSLGVSSESLTTVATTLAQAGLSAEDTRIALAALAKTELAPSFDDLVSTTEGAIAALRQFSLQTKDLEAALGSINAVAAAFAVESSDIITAIQRTGGVFASASKGVSEGKDALNEFIAVFTSVRATTRESAETIATGLRTIFTRIQRAKTIDQLKQFGVELQDLEGKFVGPFEAVRRLSEALNKLDPRDVRFSSIVEELGGFRQIGKVIPLIQQFATAQQALAVAQKGQNSLTDAQVIAQQSLANQIAKVREQFLALIRDIGKSTVFQGLFKVVLGLASGLISLASAFKPILPILAIFGAIKGVSALTQFAGGFLGGFKKGGGSKGAGENIGSSISGAKEKERAEATSRASDAIRLNTDALKSLTTAVQSLDSTIKSRGPTTLASGGKVLGFNKGGIVPGSGKGDKIPALLEPGEVVMSNAAANKYGRGNLVRMNKYAEGGTTKYSDKYYGMLIPTTNNPPDKKGVKYQDPQTQNTYVGNIRKSGFAKSDKFNELVEPSIHKEFDNIHKKLAQSINRTSLIPSIEDKAKRASRTAQGFMFENYVLSAARSKDPGKRTFDIIKPGKIIKQLTDQSISGLTDIKLSDSEQQESSIIAKASRARPQDFKNTGGRIQKFMAGSPGGIRVASGKGRGKKGPREAYGERGFKILSDREYASFSEQAYAEAGTYGGPLWDMTYKPPMPKILADYNRKVNSRIFTGIETPKVKPFDPGIKAKTIAMLEEQGDVVYGTGIGNLEKGQPGYISTELSPFRSSRKAKDSKQRKMDSRTLRRMVATAGGVDASSLSGVPIEKLLQYAEQAPRAPKEVSERTKARYASVASIKPKFIAWGKNPTAGVFADVVSGFEDQIRGELEEPNKSYFDALIKAGSLEAYKAAGGKDGHIPALKKAIYEITGVTEKSTGGLIQRFMEGSVGSQGVQSSIGQSAQDILDKLEDAGGPRRARELLTLPVIERAISKVSTSGKRPRSAGDVFDKRFLTSPDAVPFLSTLSDLADQAIAQYSGTSAADFDLTPEQIAAARDVAIAGFQTDMKDLQSYYRLRKGFPLRVHTGIITPDKYSIIDELLEEQHMAQVRAAQKFAPGENIAPIKKEDRKKFGESNLGGYNLEAILALLGSGDGKKTTQDAIDFANGLTPLAAGVFGVPPNIPTQAKLTISSSNVTKALDGIIKTFASGGQAEGPSFESVKKQIMDKYPDIDFRISKRKSGFGYMIQGGLSPSQRSQVNFASNLTDLSAISDKMAQDILYNYGPNIDSSLLKKLQKKKFAIGGSLNKTVPAMVSTGEAFVPPAAAKKIGYGKLNRMNQADKNGMKGFSGGGNISIFKGPGSGTSDSIGPIGLPEGSFVIRAKATKALGLNKGGSVGIRKFAAGGSASSQIVSYKQSLENERNRKREIENRASTATGTDKALLDEEIKKSESKINDLTAKIDEVISGYDELENTISKNSQDLYAANQLLIEKVKQQYESTSRGRKFDDLSEKSKAKIVRKARSGRYTDSSGADIFAAENENVLEAENRLVRSKRKQDTRFGDISSAEQLRESTLTPNDIKNRAQTDTAIIDYRARQQGVSADSYKYQLAQKLGQKAYETREMYAGRKEEMKSELVTRQDRFKNIGATIASAKAAATGTGPEAEAARTQLADANSRLATETENIAQQMRELNPTLSMEMVSESARKVAQLLSEGRLEEAQKAMTDALGEAPDAVTSMTIAMEKLARDLNIDVSTLERTFAEGGGQKLLERQQFIQSREGQRFGALAEFAPDLAKRFSDSKLGGAFGKGADFFSGKGGKASQFFANRLGGISGVGAGLTVGAETLKQILPKSVTSNPNAAGALGALGGAGSGAATGAQLGFMVAGPVGAMVAGIGGAVIGGIQGFFEAKNTQILTNALENVAKSTGDLDMAFKKLEQSASDANVQNTQKAFGDVIASSKPIEAMAMSKPATMAGTAMGAAAGAAMGAALGSIIPGIGTAIGAGIGALAGGAMSYFSAPSEAQRQEAMGAMVQQSGANQQTATRLAEIQLKKTSTADLNKMLDDLDKVSSSMNIITQQYAEGMIAAAEANNGTVNLTNAEKEKITVEAEARSALDAYMQKRKQAGATDEQITKEIKENEKAAIEEGKAKLKVDQELLIKQQAMARAVKMVAVESERLLDVYKRVAGAVDAMIFSIDSISERAERFAASMSGQGEVYGPSRETENILANYGNYSMSEVEKAARDASGIMGGTSASNQMTNSVVAAKMMEEQLPALLRETTGQDTDSVIAVLREKLGSVLGGDSEVLDEALKQIDERLKQQGEDKSFRELSSEDLVKELSETIKAGAETTAKVMKAWNDGLSKAANVLNKYNEAILKSEQYIREANTIRINAENDLAKALGKPVSLNQMNKAFNEEILSLTQGIGPGGAGTLDPKLIGKFIADENKKLADNAEKFNREGLGANTDQAVQRQKEYNEAQAKSQRAIKNASAALDKLASDGARAANVLAAIQDRMALAGRTSDMVRRINTSEGTELADMMLDLSSYTRAISGEATAEDYQSLAFRQQTYRGGDMIGSLVGGALGEQITAKLSLDMLRKTDPRVLGMKIPDMVYDPETKKMKTATIEELLKLRAEGKGDPETERLIAEYKEMTDVQTSALVEKAGLQEKIAADMLAELKNIYKVLERDLQNVVDRSQQQAKENAESAKQSQQNELIDQFNQTAGLYGVEKRDRSPDEIIDLFRNSGDLDRADKLQELWNKIQQQGDFDNTDLERMWTTSGDEPRSTTRTRSSSKPSTPPSATATTTPEDRARELAAIDKEMQDIRSRSRIAFRNGNIPPDLSLPMGSARHRILSETDLARYNELVKRKEEISSQPIRSSATPTGPAAWGAAPPMTTASAEITDPLDRVADMADHATQIGSIYTHDVHAEILLTNIRDILSTNNSDKNIAIKDALESQKSFSTPLTNTSLISPESILTQLQNLIGSLVTIDSTNTNTTRQTSPASAQPSTNFSNTISLDDKSIQTLNNFVGKFGEYVNQLSQFNLPSKVEIKGTFAMSVDLKGAEAFEQMGVNLKEDIISIFEPQLEYIWKNTNGALTKRPSISKTNK